MMHSSKRPNDTDFQLIRRVDSSAPNTPKTYNIFVLGDNYIEMMRNHDLPEALSPRFVGADFTLHGVDQHTVYFHDRILKSMEILPAMFKKYFQDPNTSITLIFPKDNNELVAIFNKKMMGHIKGSCFIIQPKNSDMTEIPKNTLNAQIASFPTRNVEVFLEAVIEKHSQTFAPVCFQELNQAHINNAMKLAAFFQCYCKLYKNVSRNPSEAKKWPLASFPDELVFLIATYVDPNFNKSFKEFFYNQPAQSDNKNKALAIDTLFNKVVNRTNADKSDNSKRCFVM